MSLVERVAGFWLRVGASRGRYGFTAGCTYPAGYRGGAALLPHKTSGCARGAEGRLADGAVLPERPCRGTGIVCFAWRSPRIAVIRAGPSYEHVASAAGECITPVITVRARRGGGQLS